MSKPSKEERHATKAEQLAQIQADGLSTLVTRRLTSRQRPWTHGPDGYSMAWNDISVYAPSEMAREIKAQLAARGMPDARIEFNDRKDALCIIVPEAQFNKAALQPEHGHRGVRIHEARTGHGGRA